jgi:hypothetical protein
MTTNTTGLSARQLIAAWMKIAAALLTLAMTGTVMGAPRWDEGLFYGPGGVGAGNGRSEVFVACLNPLGASRYVLGRDNVRQLAWDNGEWRERSDAGVTGAWHVEAPADGGDSRSWRTEATNSTRTLLQIDKIVFPVAVQIDCSTLRTANATGLKIKPVDGTKTLKALAIAAGTWSTCAVLDDHSARCWGSRLGPTEGKLPLADVVAMGGPNGNDCLITQGGHVSCWLRDSMGVSSPHKLPTLAHVKHLGIGGTLCAIKDDNRLLCADAEGNMGSVAGVPAATDVAGSIVFGDRHCAVVPNGDVYCWGDLATHNPVGDEEAIVKNSTATRLSFVHDASKVVDNQGENCALLKNGSLICWTYGPDSEPVAIIPSKPSPLTGFRDVATGSSTCGLMTDGRVACRLLQHPVFVSGVEHAISLSVGREQGCALIEGGGIRCWGRNEYGTLGSLANRDIPTDGDAQFVSHAPIGFVNYQGDRD